MKGLPVFYHLLYLSFAFSKVIYLYGSIYLSMFWTPLSRPLSSLSTLILLHLIRRVATLTDMNCRSSRFLSFYRPIVQIFTAILEHYYSLIEDTFYRDDLFSSIIVFEGIWNFDKVKLARFFSVNNDARWREAYHDVEIDAYGKGEFEELVDYLWKQDLIETIARSFIDEIKREGRGKLAKPREIYFSIGAPEYGEVTNLILLHLKDWHNFIGFLYSKLRRDKARWIKNKVVPIDRHFFLSSIREPKNSSNNPKENS